MFMLMRAVPIRTGMCGLSGYYPAVISGVFSSEIYKPEQSVKREKKKSLQIRPGSQAVNLSYLVAKNGDRAPSLLELMRTSFSASLRDRAGHPLFGERSSARLGRAVGTKWGGTTGLLRPGTEEGGYFTVTP